MKLIKSVLGFFLRILTWLVSLIWNFIWSTVLITALALALLFVFQRENAYQTLDRVLQEAELIVKGQSPVKLQEGVDTIKHLATDTVNTGDHGRWESNRATVYIESQEPILRQAYVQAIANWNQTGAFTFELIDSPEAADIIATDVNDSTTQAAGEANSTTNLLTNFYTSVTVRLNRYYLLNPQYGYEFDRILHTAEHELGHALGLGHEDGRASVMESAGSYTGIQQEDVDAVIQLYANN